MNTTAIGTQHHPAKFSPSIREKLAAQIVKLNPPGILDPYCGIGGIFRVVDSIADTGEWQVIGLEIEEEFAAAARLECSSLQSRLGVGSYVSCTDSAEWRPIAGMVSGWTVVTSPDYGNRMADQYLGTPSERALRAETGKRPRRMSYAISLGRRLSDGNGARHKFGPAYKELHSGVAQHIGQLLCEGPNGRDAKWVLNISDFYERKALVHVTDWWVQMLSSFGWKVLEWDRVDTPRMLDGANSELRADTESIITFGR